MAQRAREHGRRVVGDIAAVGREREVEREDVALAVEADVVADQERMALAGRAHVVVARQPQLHRPPRLPGQHRGDAGDDGRLALLAAEGAAHAPHLDGDRVERQAEQMRDAVLHLGRMLGRAPHLHVAGVAGGRERDLSFEIEVVLAAAAQFARQAMRRAGERGLDIAAHHRLRRRDEAVARHRLLDRQHGGQRLVVDLDQLRRRARLVERAAAIAATGWPSYSTTSAASAGSSLRIGAMSFLPGMSAAVIAAITPGAASARDKSMRRMRACACGLSTSAASSVPGTVGTSSR